MHERLQPTGVAGEWHAGKSDVSGSRRVYIESSTSKMTEECILLIHDMTEAYIMQEQNRRNQRLAAMGEMAAGLAHQLRTPLSAALLYAGHLSGETLTAAERNSFAVKTVERLHHLEHLIRNMLQFVKGEPVPAGTVELSALLRKLERTMASQMQRRHLRFMVQDDSRGSSLNVDREALCSVMTNLLENAMQVSPAGSLITLTGEITADEARLTVTDEGPGIDPILHERLFEPFFTTRTDGTGLGLAIVHNVIRSMQGEIQLDSAPGAGSRFTVRLPRRTKETAGTAPVRLNGAEISGNKGG